MASYYKKDPYVFYYSNRDMNPYRGYKIMDANGVFLNEKFEGKSAEEDDFVKVDNQCEQNQKVDNQCEQNQKVDNQYEQDAEIKSDQCKNEQKNDVEKQKTDVEKQEQDQCERIKSEQKTDMEKHEQCEQEQEQKEKPKPSENGISCLMDMIVKLGEERDRQLAEKDEIIRKLKQFHEAQLKSCTEKLIIQNKIHQNQPLGSEQTIPNEKVAKFEDDLNSSEDPLILLYDLLPHRIYAKLLMKFDNTTRSTIYKKKAGSFATVCFYYPGEITADTCPAGLARALEYTIEMAKTNPIPYDLIKSQLAAFVRVGYARQYIAQLLTIEDQKLIDIILTVDMAKNHRDMPAILAKFPQLILNHYDKITPKFAKFIIESPDLKTLVPQNKAYVFENLDDFRAIVAKHYPHVIMGRYFTDKNAALIAFEKSGRNREIFELLNPHAVNWIKSKFFPDEHQKKIEEEFVEIQKNIQPLINPQ